MADTIQNRALGRSLVSLIALLAFMVAVLFGPAGTLDWPKAWCFIALFVVAMLIAIVVIWRLGLRFLRF
jgi:hypothetical protein